MEFRRLRQKRGKLFTAAVLVFVVYVIYRYWDLILTNGLDGTANSIVISVAGRKTTINLLDPYTVKDDANITCLPLLSAERKELICTYPTKEDDIISITINTNTVWEHAYVKHVKKILTDDPEKGLIDIGTNIGVYTLTVASMGRQVVGVEPYPPNIQRLAKSLRKNPHLLPFVKVVTNGLSGKYEKLHFWARPNHPGGTRTFSEAERASRALSWPEMVLNEVENLTVDTILAQDLLEIITFKRAVLKIDIEGHEFQAFQNAARLFDEIDISHVFMEWERKGQRPIETMYFLSFFMSRGYTAHNAYWLTPLGMKFEDCKNWPFEMVWIKSPKKNV